MADEDLTGQVIADRYELVRRIGHGAMGAVYESRHAQTRKRCAVKLLHRLELAGDAEVVRRFFREARASGTIESDHVVAAYDSGLDGANRPYYVMEYLEGEDLADALLRVGALSPTVAIKILLQAAAGVARAHAHGIIHRDLKPANLFLAVGANDEITVKVLDFGVAKVRQQLFGESSNALTRGEALLGTPEYMSPEQLKRASAIDESADVWSLAVVLFECLTGRHPWSHAESIGEMLAAVLTSPVPAVQDLAPWVSPGLAKVVHEGLQRDLTRRTATAEGFRASLAAELPGNARLSRHEIAGPTSTERRAPADRLALADTLGVGIASASPVAVSSRPEVRRRFATVGFVAAGAAVLGGASTLVMMRPDGPSRPQPGAPNLVETASAVPTAIPASPVSFQLEVEPPNATVRVDGKEMTVKAGKVSIEGLVGTSFQVEAAHDGRRHEEKVVIAKDGLVPARLSFPAVVAKPVVKVPKRESKQLTPPLVPPAPPAPSSPPAEAGLSQKFE